MVSMKNEAKAWRGWERWNFFVAFSGFDIRPSCQAGGLKTSWRPGEDRPLPPDPGNFTESNLPNFYLKIGEIGKGVFSRNVKRLGGFWWA